MDYKLFRDRFKAAVAPLEAEFGIDIHLKTIRHDAASFQATLHADIHNDKADDLREQQFKAAAKLADIPEDWYNKVVIDRGEKYQVTGINLRASKNILEITNMSNNQKYRAPKGWVTQRL